MFQLILRLCQQIQLMECERVVESSESSAYDFQARRKHVTQEIVFFWGASASLLWLIHCDWFSEARTTSYTQFAPIAKRPLANWFYYLPRDLFNLPSLLFPSFMWSPSFCYLFLSPSSTFYYGLLFSPFSTPLSISIFNILWFILWLRCFHPIRRPILSTFLLSPLHCKSD